MTGDASATVATIDVLVPAPESVDVTSAFSAPAMKMLGAPGACSRASYSGETILASDAVKRTDSVPGLLSIIIPCYNAGRWLREAINSALAQTYPSIEIIVVDDGSTNESISVARSYGERVLTLTTENRGASAARNLGFAHSRGEYIQYLDADDYLLPDKCERHIAHLAFTGYDIVYGDWRYEYWPPASSVYYEDHISTYPDDFLLSFIGGWWIALHAFLYRASVIELTGGWNETIGPLDDREFGLRIALLGSSITYCPGISCVYRRHSSASLSQRSQLTNLRSEVLILASVEAALRAEGRLSPSYATALAQSYFHAARSYFAIDHTECRHLLGHAQELSPGFRPRESRMFQLAHATLGFEPTERLARATRILRSRHMTRSARRLIP
jgi:GT2 family glycosyltransferase